MTRAEHAAIYIVALIVLFLGSIGYFFGPAGFFFLLLGAMGLTFIWLVWMLVVSLLELFLEDRE